MHSLPVGAVVHDDGNVRIGVLWVGSFPRQPADALPTMRSASMPATPTERTPRSTALTVGKRRSPGLTRKGEELTPERLSLERGTARSVSRRGLVVLTVAVVLGVAGCGGESRLSAAQHVAWGSGVLNVAV